MPGSSAMALASFSIARSCHPQIDVGDSPCSQRHRGCPWRRQGPLRTGVAHMRMGGNSEAIEGFSAILNPDPDNSGALFARAVARQWLGRHEEASKDYERLFELAPDEAGALTTRSCERGCAPATSRSRSEVERSSCFGVAIDRVARPSIVRRGMDANAGGRVIDAQGRVIDQGVGRSSPGIRVFPDAPPAQRGCVPARPVRATGSPSGQPWKGAPGVRIACRACGARVLRPARPVQRVDASIPSPGEKAAWRAAAWALP